MSEIRKRMIAEVDRNEFSPVAVEAGARLAISAVYPELERLEALVKAQAKRIEELERRWIDARCGAVGQPLSGWRRR